MSTNANDLIERLEKETGQRIDSKDGDNLAMAGLIGAISRLMGKSPPSYREMDDVVAGLYLRHQMSEAGNRERAQNEMLADLLRAGMNPDDIAALMK